MRKMPSFNSIADLEKYIRSAIKNSLKNEVFEKVRDVEQQHIDDDVYGVYKPAMYKRRDINEGLIADKNIKKTMIGDDTLQVTNETKPNPIGYPQSQVTTKGKNLAMLVEGGDGASGVYDFPSDDEDAYMNPRPFTQNTIDELAATGKHTKALQDGLRRNKIDSQ